MDRDPARRTDDDGGCGKKMRGEREGDGPEGAVGEVEGAGLPGGLEDPIHASGGGGRLRSSDRHCRSSSTSTGLPPAEHNRDHSI